MPALTGAAMRILGAGIAQSQRLHGGDLSEVTRLTLTNGQSVVAKQTPLAAREARMLAALAAAGGPTPAVLGQEGDLLFLQDLGTGTPDSDAWARFGMALAGLHRHPGARYGWSEDYAFGPIAIDNRPRPYWPDFWAERRLLPFLPILPAPLAARLNALAPRLPELLPRDPGPGLLHGDLWTGNLHVGTERQITLIDPACYRGDGEVDLAMLNLFGSPGAGFASAYGPLAPGWQTRRAIYSLFPALVHFRLFGRSYLPMVDRFLTAAGT